jgi:hypothetical protein
VDKDLLYERWDKSEKRKEELLNIIRVWDGKSKIPKELTFEIVEYVIKDFAQQEKIEFENTNEGFAKLLFSCTWNCETIRDVDETDDRQQSFFVFSVLCYGIEIIRYGNENPLRLTIAKYNDKQIEAHMKLIRGEITKEEFRREENEARYPTLEDKEQLILSTLEGGVDVDIESEKAREILRGYEDAPSVYKMLRLGVFHAVGKVRMEPAHIEKILDNQIKEMLKAGKINVKTYRIVQKLTRKRQRQDLHSS